MDLLVWGAIGLLILFVVIVMRKAFKASLEQKDGET